MCPHEPEVECRHINQIMTVRVTCVTGPVIINHVSAINCNFVLSYFSTLCTNKNVYHY